MGDVNLEIKLNNLDDRVIKIEESGGGGGDGYITSVSNDFNVVNKKLSLSTDVTTKLPKSVPTTSDAGKVATVQSDGTVDWKTLEPTDLETGMIGGDEWVSGGSYTIGESVVIDENKLYLLVGDGGSTTKPSTDITHTIWEETSISAINSKLQQKLNADRIKNCSFKSGFVSNPNITVSKGTYLLIILKIQYEQSSMWIVSDSGVVPLVNNCSESVTVVENENNITISWAKGSYSNYLLIKTDTSSPIE